MSAFFLPLGEENKTSHQKASQLHLDFTDHNQYQTSSSQPLKRMCTLFYHQNTPK